MLKALLPVLLFVVALHAQAPENDVLNMDSFPSFVRSAKQIEQRRPDSSEPGDTLYFPIVTKAFLFDKNGNKIREEILTSDNTYTVDTIWFSTDSMTKYEKSTAAPAVCLTTTHYNSDRTIQNLFVTFNSKVQYSHAFEYNDRKQVVRFTTTMSELNLKQVMEFSYGQTEFVTGLKSFSSRGSDTLYLESEVLIARNKDGKAASELRLRYTTDGRIRSRDSVFYLYDQTGRLSRKTEIRNNGISTDTCDYRYDEKGRISSIACEGNDSTSYRYDAHGFLSEIISKYGIKRWSATYNEKGLPVRCMYAKVGFGDILSSEEVLYTWEYEYW